jgi:hypothetical protein
MTPWQKEKLAREVIAELEPHASGAWFTPQAIVVLPKFKCSEEMALEVFADLIKRKMLVSAPFTVPIEDKAGKLSGVFVSAWSVNDDQRREIKAFIHEGGIWHMYISPTVKWFWGISRARLLIILTFAIAAFAGGFLSEAGKSAWDRIKWGSMANADATAPDDKQPAKP